MSPSSDGRPGARLGPWRLVERTTRLAFLADEGLVTVPGPRGGRRVIYRGGLSPALLEVRLRDRRRWVHIGDPDAHGDVVVDCYQGPSGTTEKMFTARRPGRPLLRAVHRLDAGRHELLNNSFVAVAPEGPWMLSGEWERMERLLVFPTPGVHPEAGDDLPLSAELSLDHPVRNVQGATFLDPVTVLCSTDDPATDLWPVARQLLQIDLDRPLDGGPASGRVTLVGALPLVSRCSGTYEVEGLDYDRTTGDLRVLVLSPGLCSWRSAVYRYRRDQA